MTHTPELTDAIEAAAIEATVARMAEVAKDWTDEEFASRAVGLLIHDEGNLNKYQRTIELVLKVHRRALASHKTGG